jgi:AcrR family transcriptional regulator
VARTRAIDFDDKLKRILDTAADLFAEKGFAIATTTDIAVACRMSKSALYHYHKSKEAILYALLVTHMSEVINQVQVALDSVVDPQGRLHAFLTALLKSNAASRSKNIVLLNETWALAPEQFAEVKRLEKRLVRIGSDLLKALNPDVMAQNALRMPYAMFLFGLVNWTYTWYDPDGAIEPEEIAERIADLFLNGFPQVSVSIRHKNVVRLRRSTGTGS